MKKLFSTVFALIVLNSFSVFANTSQGDDLMYSSGKIYVVVAVLVAMFLGIVIYLVFIDRKLTKLENQININE